MYIFFVLPSRSIDDLDLLEDGSRVFPGFLGVYGHLSNGFHRLPGIAHEGMHVMIQHQQQQHQQQQQPQEQEQQQQQQQHQHQHQ